VRQARQARQAPRARPGRAAALAAAIALLALVVAPPAWAGWNRPQRLAGPYSLDVLPAQLAFAPTGEAAIGFGVRNEDRPSTSQAYEMARAASGRTVKARPVPPSRQPLDLAYSGRDLTVLAGAASGNALCCSSARLVKVKKGRPDQRVVADQLVGASLGHLLALPRGRMMSAIATTEGVWVELASPKGRPAPARMLTPKPAVPQTMSATSLKGNRTVVGWTAAAAQPASASPPGIVVAEGSATRAPRRPRLAVRVAAGHQIDELALGRGRSAATAAWVESFYDAAGVLHSQVSVADLGRSPRAKTFAISGQLASGVSLASNAAGAQLLAWKACDVNGACGVEAVTRDSGKRFGAPVRLGSADASQLPVAAISTRGPGLVAWIDDGHVVSAARARGARGFSAVSEVSVTNFAADLTLGFGPGNTALAVWTQGTLAQSVMGAQFKP
jgi:hypothetical protein